MLVSLFIYYESEKICSSYLQLLTAGQVINNAGMKSIRRRITRGMRKVALVPFFTRPKHPKSSFSAIFLCCETKQNSENWPLLDILRGLWPVLPDHMTYFGRVKEKHFHG